MKNVHLNCMFYTAAIMEAWLFYYKLLQLCKSELESLSLVGPCIITTPPNQWTSPNRASNSTLQGWWTKSMPVNVVFGLASGLFPGEDQPWAPKQAYSSSFYWADVCKTRTIQNVITWLLCTLHLQPSDMSNIGLLIKSISKKTPLLDSKMVRYFT